MTKMTELSVHDVARFLLANPDFFTAYPQLLERITVPCQHGNGAISISERQVLLLREKYRQLELNLSELISYGEKNDIISAKLHKLALALISATDIAGVLRAIYLQLGGSFVVPHVAMRLWGIPSQPDLPEFQAVEENVRAYTLTLKAPWCGAQSLAEIMNWLSTKEEPPPVIASIALLPLRDDTTSFGLLVMGSEDAKRFAGGIGGHFLNQISDLIATALLRTSMR